MSAEYRRKSYDHINAKKAFDKIQDLFTIKAFNKLDIEGDFLNPISH